MLNSSIFITRPFMFSEEMGRRSTECAICQHGQTKHRLSRGLHVFLVVTDHSDLRAVQLTGICNHTTTCHQRLKSEIFNIIVLITSLQKHLM